MIVMPGAWRCEQHRLWTNNDCPDCDADLIAATDAAALSAQSERAHEFEEDVDDYSMCVCGVPALTHDEVALSAAERQPRPARRARRASRPCPGCGEPMLAGDCWGCF